VESARNSASGQRNAVSSGGAAPEGGQPSPRVIQNPALSGGTEPAAAGSPGTDASNANSAAPAAQTPALQPLGGKIAHIRYQVPPLARPLHLKIEMVDPSGKKVLLDRAAKSGEYVSLDAPYSRECAVTIYLGGEFVWQDRYM
jgi:serine/threonine-protein kinase